MSFDAEFLSMFPQTVTWTPISGLSTDGYGVMTYSTSGTKTLQARIEQKRRLVRDAVGREVVSSTTVFVPPYDNSTGQTAVVISVSDRITLPSGFLSAGSSTPPIIAVEREQDDVGDHHFAVYM